MSALLLVPGSTDHSGGTLIEYRLAFEVNDCHGSGVGTGVGVGDGVGSGVTVGVGVGVGVAVGVAAGDGVVARPAAADADGRAAAASGVGVGWLVELARIN